MADMMRPFFGVPRVAGFVFRQAGIPLQVDQGLAGLFLDHQQEVLGLVDGVQQGPVAVDIVGMQFEQGLPDRVEIGHLLLYLVQLFARTPARRC